MYSPRVVVAGVNANKIFSCHRAPRCRPIDRGSLFILVITSALFLRFQDTFVKKKKKKEKKTTKKKNKKKQKKNKKNKREDNRDVFATRPIS